ncbi:MAG: FAD-dependent oxidoreductase [Clostridia bacterium]|nr:FAD-dependent oxidoreductase [Clostridia bacterium]
MEDSIMSILNAKEYHVCVIGSGLSGLCCARSLAKLGFKVHVIEQLNTLGGLIRPAKIGDEYAELLPHHLRKTDKGMLQLCKELGIKDKINWYDSLWQGRAAKRKIGYFDGGFNDLTNALSQDITDNDGIFYYSTVATEIVYNNVELDAEATLDSNTDANSDSYRNFCIKCMLHNNSRHRIYCDYVILTGPCNQLLTSSSTLNLPKEYKKDLKSIKYGSTLSLILTLKKNPSDAYFRYIEQSDIPFTRIVNHSACFGERKYGGHLVYLVGDMDAEDPLWAEDDETIKKLYFNAFQKLYPSIKKTDIKNWRLTKCKNTTVNKYPQAQILNPVEGLLICSPSFISELHDKNNENRMEHCFTLSEKVVNNIIALTRDKRASLVQKLMSDAEKQYIVD